VIVGICCLAEVKGEAIRQGICGLACAWSGWSAACLACWEDMIMHQLLLACREAIRVHSSLLGWCIGAIHSACSTVAL
jgi:hypothetical protein